LELDINRCARWFEAEFSFLEKAIGYDELLQLRGLKEFKLAYATDYPPLCQRGGWWCLSRDVTNLIRRLPETCNNLSAIEEEIEDIEWVIREVVTQKK
jgi:hypothetical protein